jgi:hypothetical protein
MKLLISLGFVLLLMSSTAFVIAQDLPNDPTVNDDANACYTGGTMEGRCGTVDHDGNGVIDDYESEWDFRCGWYLIRYQYQMISSVELPSDCRTLVGFEADTDGCNLEADQIVRDLTAGDTINVRFSDNDCSFTSSSSGFGLGGINVIFSGVIFPSVANDFALGISFSCVVAGMPYSIKGFYFDANEGPMRVSITGNCL